MRIRSIKPEFWRSKTIADLSWDARLVLKGLESYVDDNGVGKYDLELIISDVFSRDHFRNPRETVARVSEAISEVIQAGLVIRYVVDGEELLYIDKWKDIQRVDKPNSGRHRRPDGTLEYSEAVNRDSYRKPREEVANVPEVLAPVTGEQGSSGTEEKGSSVLAPQADAPTNKRGTRLPGEWMPSEAVIAAMREECPTIDLQAEHRKFIDHWKSKTGRDATKLDWEATFRNWIRNARPPLRSVVNGNPMATSDLRVMQAQALKTPNPVTRLELE